MTASDAGRFRTAIEAYEDGRYADAQSALQDLARRYPSNADVQAAEGMLLVESGKIGEGLPFLAQAHRLNPGNDSVAANLGLAYLKAGMPSEAVAPLQQACKVAPQNFIYRVASAQALFSSQHYAEAAAAYGQAAALPHKEAEMPSTELHSQWGVALMSAGKPAEAASVLRSDSSLDQNAALQALLGEAEEKSGNFEKAFQAFKRAAELDPSENNIGAYGEELLRHWAFSAAKEIYLYGVGRYPSSDRMKTGLGTAYFGGNDFANAADIFARVLRSRPEDATIGDMLGRSCSAEVAGEIPACDGLVEFAEKHPGNASATLYAGIALMRRPKAEGKDSDADALLRSAIEADPKLAEAWYQLGTLQQSRGEWKESISSLERAIALRPAFSEAHYHLARAYARSGRKEDSQREILLQQKYAQAAKEAENQRMKDVITFVTNSH
jgi:predicted Zn-dependent protease